MQERVLIADRTEWHNGKLLIACVTVTPAYKALVSGTIQCKEVIRRAYRDVTTQAQAEALAGAVMNNLRRRAA